MSEALTTASSSSSSSPSPSPTIPPAPSLPTDDPPPEIIQSGAADDRAARKVAWSQAEDVAILELTKAAGMSWEAVAARLEGRTADAVRQRWHRLQKQLKVSGTHMERGIPSARSRTAWSDEEDAILLEGIRQYGYKWRAIVARLPGRTDSSTMSAASTPAGPT